LALAAGVHPKVVQERLGHSSIGITLDTYSHVVQGMQAEAAAKVAGLLLAGSEQAPPARLKLDQTFETWVPATPVRADHPERAVRVRLSSNKVVKGRLNEHVPLRGGSLARATDRASPKERRSTDQRPTPRSR
jgi:hypothetical protein